MVVVQLVVSLAHGVQPVGGIYHHCFRGIEGVPGSQEPTKFLRMDPDHKPGGPIVIHFRLSQKITAVYEIEAVHFTRMLSRVRLS
ncbi:hypothetical protein D3C75_1270750 [compost metagenome]